MASQRRPIHFNPSARDWTTQSTLPDELVQLIDSFHRQLSDKPTRLVRLDGVVTQELDVGAVYLKDESSRFGLSSFKILGASWGTFRALVSELGLPLDTDITTTKRALAEHPVPLYAASAGNHGWAVARMGAILTVPVEIHVPANIQEATIRFIKEEGARVVVSTGTYDAALLEAQCAARKNRGLLIQDFAFDGYEDVPKWIVDGYMTMMREIDYQLHDVSPDLVITPVGVGSFAQAVVSHFKKSASKTTIMAVEPDTAPCLWKSLTCGKVEEVETGPTIMAGLACGAVSSIAWPLLQSGVDASVTVSDYEAHEATQSLEEAGVFSGPCGAATLAALRRLTPSDRGRLGLGKASTIVLLSTEGTRDYEIPLSVSAENAVSLTQALVQINSTNPSLGSVPGQEKPTLPDTSPPGSSMVTLKLTG